MSPHTTHSANLNSSGSPSSAPLNTGGSGATFDIASPTSSAGIATRNPANGPATPMSNSAGFVVIGCLMRMNAPAVPVSGNGMGRK